NFAARQTKGVDLVALQDVELPLEDVPLNSQVDLALERLDGGRIRNPAADQANAINLRTAADDPGLAQDLFIGLTAQREFLVRRQGQRLRAMAGPGVIAEAARRASPSKEDQDEAHRRGDRSRN